MFVATEIREHDAGDAGDGVTKSRVESAVLAKPCDERPQDRTNPVKSDAGDHDPPVGLNVDGRHPGVVPVGPQRAWVYIERGVHGAVGTEPDNRGPVGAVRTAKKEMSIGKQCHPTRR